MGREGRSGKEGQEREAAAVEGFAQGKEGVESRVACERSRRSSRR